MNPHFKKPLKITGIAFLVALVLVVIGATWLYNQDLSARRMNERASMMGSGIGVMTALVVAPFWFIAAAKIGKAKREAREAKKNEHPS